MTVRHRKRYSTLHTQAGMTITAKYHGATRQRRYRYGRGHGETAYPDDDWETGRRAYGSDSYATACGDYSRHWKPIVYRWYLALSIGAWPQSLICKHPPNCWPSFNRSAGCISHTRVRESHTDCPSSMTLIFGLLSIIRNSASQTQRW